MMSTVDLPLPKLALRLAQKQSELEEARRAYENRLADLKRQKDDLQTQLRSVETEIQAVSARAPDRAAQAPKAPAHKASAAKSASPKATTPAASSAAKGSGGPTLPRFLMDLVRAAGKPITVKQLTDKVEKAKFPTTSHNLARMVKNKVGVLVKRGLLRRADGQPGVVLARSGAAKTAPAAKAVPSPRTVGGNGKAAPVAATSAKATEAQAKGSLRELLVQLLAGSTKPLRAKELADKALATGYKTESKDFVNVVWDALGKVKEVENVRGQGYRLKKRPAKG